MHIAVFVKIIMTDAIDDAQRFLTGSPIIKIHQLFVPNLGFKYRKLTSDSIDI